ncbi:MAG TPA: hypothetical protein PKA27_01925, partial [Fimbriimonadaceae bacterium]|nr:hypothetical protein [Fimbriimonadaceae bacterium]
MSEGFAYQVFETLKDAVFDHVLLLDDSERIVRCRLADESPGDPAAFLGKCLTELMDPDSYRTLRETLDAANASGSPQTCRYDL